MFNIKQNLYFTGVFALCALAGCSSDNPSSAGSSTIPNATAENSSSSEEILSSSSMTQANNSGSSIDKRDIVFATAATSTKKIAQGEVTVYGKEYGAEATCSAGKYSSTKEYISRIHINESNTMERTLMLRNFGSTCDSLLSIFKESCSSGLVDVVADAACSRNGDLKVFCYASTTESVRACNASGGCTSLGPDSTIDFNAIVDDFTTEADNICSSIADGVDSTEFDLPTSEPDSSIKANSGRIFILEPNTTDLEVSNEERTILDSLAQAFPQKTRIDQIDGMTIFINYDAEYKFTTEGKKFILSEEDNICNGSIYQEESGVTRLVEKYGNWRSTKATILLVPDIGIVYLVNDGTNSAKEPFQTECEATNGSFYDYRPDGPVAVACAVKNFTEIPFETIVSEQGNLCKNNYAILPEFTPAN